MDLVEWSGGMGSFFRRIAEWVCVVYDVAIIMVRNRSFAAMMVRRYGCGMRRY